MASLDLAGIITRVCSDLAYRFAPLYHTHSNYAPVSHAHGTISSVGDITATAPTIASGDKLIINDESASKVTNGPSFGSSTTTFLANNGTWQTPAGTYSLPTASTSTLGGVKVDGSTITITDGVISSSGGGGGGNSGMTFFVSSVSTNNTPYIDSGLTTTVMEYYEYDLDAAWGDIRDASSIRLVQGYSASDTRICYVTSVVYDRSEDAIELCYFLPRSNSPISASIL